MSTYKVVVYGGGLPGVFAAAKASAELGGGEGNVALIVPTTKSRYKNASGVWEEDYLLGGIMGPGGINYWDDRGYNGFPAEGDQNPYPNAIQQGSYYFYRWKLGDGFSNIELSNECKKSMTNGHVKVFYGYDIVNFATTTHPYIITSVTIRKIERNAAGNVVFSNGATETLNATVFIDASNEGRLARRVNTACTTGRFDWPAQYLSSGEIGGSDFVARQQACSLVLKIKNIHPTHCNYYEKTDVPSCLWSPSAPYEDPNGLITAFNEAHKSEGLLLRPTNGGRDGRYSDEWWINTLLVFNVDGRAHYRDEASNTPFKVTRKFGYMTTDQAWIKAKNFVKTHKTEIERALATFDGFSNASIVMDDRGDPVVADELYIRETVHMAIDSTKRANNTNTNYHITLKEAKDAGSGPDPSAADYANYATRIGLAEYSCDIHPYTPEDMKVNGRYVWGLPSFQKMYPGAENPKHPVYMPYQTLITDYVANLLSPGYGASVCSYSWGEIRVISNLSVLGDAAGLAAAYCCKNNIYPYILWCDSAHMSALQQKIIAIHGRINK